MPNLGLFFKLQPFFHGELALGYVQCTYRHFESSLNKDKETSLNHRTKLPQKPYIVLKKQPDVVDVVQPHRLPLDAHTEGIT